LGLLTEFFPLLPFLQSGGIDMFTKFLFIVLSVFSYSSVTLACSELGKLDFELNSAAVPACKEKALQYALSLAKTRGAQEKTLGQKPPYKLSTDTGNIFEAINGDGSARSVGFTASVKSKNGWDCLYCVKMILNEKDQCSFERISLHHCAL